MGKKIDELMDDEEPVFIDDLLYEQELFEYQMQKNCQM